MKQVQWIIHLAQTVCIRRVNSDAPLARIYGSYSRAEANARLIVEATNACKEINGENPMAAAQAISEMWQFINDAKPAIEAEAENRAAALFGHSEYYYRQTRELVDRLEALISKAMRKM